MTAADNATAKPTHKRMSTTAKVFWILLALLSVVVAGFVFSAWRELNRIAPPVANPAGTTQQVEVLTPTGAAVKTGTGNLVETPLQPINVPAAKPAATDKTAEKPAAKPKNTLDNLF